jgi:hypothetical protein
LRSGRDEHGSAVRERARRWSAQAGAGQMTISMRAAASSRRRSTRRRLFVAFVSRLPRESPRRSGDGPPGPIVPLELLAAGRRGFASGPAPRPPRRASSELRHDQGSKIVDEFADNVATGAPAVTARDITAESAKKFVLFSESLRLGTNNYSAARTLRTTG